MSESRLDKLKKLVEKSPEKPFPKYALALEYRNQGKRNQAQSLFSELVQLHPDYLPTYFHFGQLLANMGEEAAAANIFKRGLATAEQQNDDHAYSELEEALKSLDA